LQFIATLAALSAHGESVPLQNEPVVEIRRKPNALRDRLSKDPFEHENGQLRVPSGPGLGSNRRGSSAAIFD
jgi:hypothetical protein